MSVQIMDWKRRWQRGLGQPFDGNNPGNPFGSFSAEYCPRCEMVVDSDTKAHHDGQNLYLYKRWCLRCGKVLKSGRYNNVPLIGEGALSPSPTMRKELEFITTPEMDRRGRAKR